MSNEEDADARRGQLWEQEGHGRFVRRNDRGGAMATAAMATTNTNTSSSSSSNSSRLEGGVRRSRELALVETSRQLHMQGRLSSAAAALACLDPLLVLPYHNDDGDGGGGGCGRSDRQMSHHRFEGDEEESVYHPYIDYSFNDNGPLSSSSSFYGVPPPPPRGGGGGVASQRRWGDSIDGDLENYAPTPSNHPPFAHEGQKRQRDQWNPVGAGDRGDRGEGRGGWVSGSSSRRGSFGSSSSYNSNNPASKLNNSSYASSSSSTGMNGAGRRLSFSNTGAPGSGGGGSSSSLPFQPGVWQGRYSKPHGRLF